VNHRFDSKSSICKDGVVLATPIDRNNYIGLTRYQGLAMTENSRSESMEDAAQQSLLERHRSPSATEIYTNARSYLFDSKDEVILVPDDPGENENYERGNIISGNANGPVSGTNVVSSSSGIISSRTKEKIQKIPTRYRSQSAESVPAISMATSTTATAGVAAISTKKPSLDRARTDSLSSVKDKMTSTFEKTNSKRQLDKPFKKNGSFSHVSSSPEASKQVVPPLSTTPELSRTSNKSKHKSSSTKKLVSRSYNESSGGGSGTGALKTSSGNAAMFSTPPRHVGSLRDELTHTPTNIPSHTHLTTSSSSIPDNVQSQSVSVLVHTPVRDSSPSRHSGKTTKVTPTTKLKASSGNSRASSPSPVDSARSSRSNSGSSNSQLGVVSPLTVDNVDGGKLSIGQSVAANVPSNATNSATSSTHGGQLAAGYGNSGSSVLGNSATSGGAGAGSSNPFASSSSAAGPLGGGTQPKEKNNIFERRLQEAQALNRKELVEGAVMHEFSLWKNFSNANANAALGGADTEKTSKDCDVAPPKRSSRLRINNMSRATDEALEHSDRDMDSPRSVNGSSSSNHRGNVKVKPLSPVSTTGNVKPKSGRKHNSAKKGKNVKVLPIASLSYDDEDGNLGSGVDEVSVSNTILKSTSKNRVRPLQTIEAAGGSFEVEDEFGVMQQYEVSNPVPSVSPPLTPSRSPLHDNGSEHVALGVPSRGLATNFRSMVGSCKKSSNSASDMESILSERSVEISEPFTMHRSVTDSIASIESSVHSNYEREGFEEFNELAIFGVAHEEDDDVDLSFISEDDNCVMVPLSDEQESNRVFSDDLDSGSNAVERTLVLSKGVDDDLLDESVDVKELEEDGDSLLLSHSQSQELSNSSTNHVPFSPRAIMDEEIEHDNCHPPLMVKAKTANDASFSNELLDTSLDHSAEVVNTSFDSGHANDFAVPLLQPLVTDDEVPFVIPALASHALIKGKSRSPRLLGDLLAAGSPPSSSRLPTERTTERHTRSNIKSHYDNFGANTGTCMMSATLGSPPPLLKANLQAKQSIKRNNFQDKGSTETKKSEKRVKSRSGNRQRRSNDNEKRNSKPVQKSPPRIVRSKSETADIHDEGDSDCDHSISSELSEMSNDDFDPDDPFPMTEAEKEELQLQQHRKFLQMGGLGHLAKNGALTAPAVLGSQDSSKQSISGSIEAQQLKSDQEEEQPADQMYQLDNGCQWKKGNDVLGQGSFGQVYKGMNYDTGELLAVKQICLSDGTEGEVSLLRKEIDVMKDLNHPNIVRYVGTSISSRYLFIVLEYVPGGSVAGTLSQFGAFSEPLIKRFVTQIIAGVEYLHQKQIIHRDIKGANVLVTDAGVAKLADFGCSKQLGGMVTASLEESMRIIRGSVPWMAPEVIKQVGHGRSADLWSVGATMIEMATAKHPWPEFSNNLAALFHVATSKDPPPIPPHLSPACALFMSRCLVIDPKERATAHDLKDDPFLQTAT